MRPPRRPHLLVLVHGVHGEATDFSLVSSLLRKPHLSVLSSRASRSASGSTADGIERAGERVANEIASACDALSADGGDITFVGHSNGGLVSRWALGALEERGVLERWRPNAFVSLSSPHLGVSRKGGVGANPLEHEVLQPVVLRVVNTGLYGRTGEQLALLDADGDGGEPLLASMARPGSAFVRALGRFHRRVLVCNVTNEVLVPFYSAALSPPPSGYTPLSLARTPRLSTNVLGCRVLAPAVEAEGDGGGLGATRLAMLRGLRGAGSWHRVDVDFGAKGALGLSHWLVVGKGVGAAGVKPRGTPSAVGSDTALHRARDTFALALARALDALKVSDRSSDVARFVAAEASLQPDDYGDGDGVEELRGFEA